MIHKLDPEIQQAVEEQHGGPVRVQGADASYVLMSMEVYRDIVGVGSDEELEASLQAVRAGYEAAQQGKSRPFRDFLDELGRKHELQG